MEVKRCSRCGAFYANEGYVGPKCTGKDNSWEEIYEKYDNGERKLDEHGHLIQHHDLEEIAKAFEKRAKEQKLSFWK